MPSLLCDALTAKEEPCKNVAVGEHNGRNYCRFASHKQQMVDLTGGESPADEEEVEEVEEVEDEMSPAPEDESEDESEDEEEEEDEEEDEEEPVEPLLDFDSPTPAEALAAQTCPKCSKYGSVSDVAFVKLASAEPGTPVCCTACQARWAL